MIGDIISDIRCLVGIQIESSQAFKFLAILSSLLRILPSCPRVYLSVLKARRVTDNIRCILDKS
jgi:hypothetical protein